MLIATEEILALHHFQICYLYFRLYVFSLASDVSIVDSGFDVRWTSVIAPSLTPTAAFSIGNNNPPVGVPVHLQILLLIVQQDGYGISVTAYCKKSESNHAYAAVEHIL